MRKVTKVLCILLALGMLAGSLAACGGPSTTPENVSTAGAAAAASTAANTTSASASLDPYDLKVLIAGDLPPDNDLVCKEISRVSKDELNINLTVDYTAWGDYIEKTKLRASSGEPFDIFLSFMSELPGYISRKQILPLDDIIAKRGPDLKKVISPSDWADTTVNGKIYGVPAVYISLFVNTLVIRKDLREKYGLPPLNTLSDLETYLDDVKKNEKGMIPMAIYNEGAITTPIFRAVDYGYNIPEFPMWIWNNTYYIDIDSSKKPYKVENWLKSDEAKDTVNWMAKCYNNGWTDKDLLLKRDGLQMFMSGKTAATYGCVYNLPQLCPGLTANVPNGVCELFYPYSDKKQYKTSPTCNNFSLVSATSKNPERAVMFLNWLRKSRDNYDLFMLGIKGKHWNPIGDDKAELIGVTDPSKRPYNPTPWWTEQMNWDRALTTDPQPYSEGVKLFSNKPYESASLANFVPGSDNVKTEMAQIATVWKEKVTPLICGVKSTDADYQAALAALDKAGINNVIADVQKQVDAYASATGK